jgi:survival-of-motor-neuron-related-splicing factor 30
MSEQTSIEELEKQIEEYEAQLKAVNAALQDEPDLPELMTVKQNLLDVLKSTKELLKLKREEAKVKYTNIHPLAAARGLFTGMQCEAKWSQDDNWYKATITSISEYGFGVTFSEYGNVEVVAPDAVRPRPQMEVVVVDVDQPQRPTAPSQIAVNQKGELVIPPSLKILPTDSEAIRKQKKKRIKALKSQYRSQKMDEERNKRKRSWQDFQQHGRTKRHRAGPSIFQSPDSVQGKVGVTGAFHSLPVVVFLLC